MRQTQSHIDFALLEKDLGNLKPMGYRAWCVNHDPHAEIFTVYLRDKEAGLIRVGAGQTPYDAGVAACRATPIREDGPCS